MRHRSLTLEHLEQRRLLDAKLVADISTFESKFRPPPFAEEYPPTEIREVAPFQDSLLFYVHHQGDCWSQAGQLWQTTGEEIEQPFQIETAAVAGFPDINNTAKLGITIGDRHFFSIENDCSYASQLWTTQGSFGEPTQTRPIHVFALGDISEDSLRPQNLTDFDGSLYVTVGGFRYGNELWRVDGASSRVSLVRDIDPRFADYGNGLGAYPKQLTPTKELLFFTASDGTHGRELWATDGTSANTRLVKDITPHGIESAGLGELESHEGLLFMAADDGATGSELWRSDGTHEGTLRVKDISLGATGSNPQHLTSFGGELFFTSDDGIHGRELWASDGTYDGTRLVSDIFPGERGSIISQITSDGDSLYFVSEEQTESPAFAGANGSRSELWTSDGTEQGTKQLFASRWASEAVIDQLTHSGGKLFFTADIGFGPRLWQSDRTQTGTFTVSGVPANIASIENVVDVRGTLYFTTDSRQLWQVDSSDNSRWGDVNDDGAVNVIDIDLVFDEIGRLDADLSLDIDLDGAVTPSDADTLIREIMDTLPGDITLDGHVDERDFAVWSENRFQSDTNWSTGDVNGDGQTDGSDFNILVNSSRPLTAVFEGGPLDVRAGDGAIEFEVRYSQSMELDSLDDRDVWAVRVDNQAVIPLSLVSANQSSHSSVATYRLSPPNGEWTWDDVANYEIVLPKGAVHNSDRVGIQRTTLAELQIQPEFETPSGTFIDTILVANDEDATIEVRYVDNTVIDVDSLDHQDIVLQTANESFEMALSDFKSDADGVVTATYQLAAPFDLTQIGEYVVRIVGGQVADAGGNTVPGAVIGNVSVVQDGNAPVAWLDTTQPAYVADIWRTIVVVYEDDFGLDLDSVETSSLEVTREVSGEVHHGEFLRAVINEEGTRVEASYYVNAGQSEFALPEAVSVQVKGVSDVGGTALVTGLLPSEINSELHVADYAWSMFGSPNLGGTGGFTLRVTFDEDGEVVTSPDHDFDIIVRHQESGQLLSVRESNFQALGNQVNYRVSAPPNGWMRGTYRIRLVGDRVEVGETLLPEAIVGSFTVRGETLDTEGPQAKLLTTTPISPSTSLRIRYTDNEVVSGESIGSGDLRAVHSSTGRVMESMLFRTGAIDGAFVEYQYQLFNPDGPWAPEDFGEYELHLNPDEVFDIAGNSAEGQFLGKVVVEPGNVPIRVTPQNDALVAFVTQISPVEFTLKFSPGVAETTLDSSDVLVVNAAGELLRVRVELAGFTASGATATQAVYQIYPPGDSWQHDDVGDYTIYLAVDALRGVSGEVVPSLPLGTLSVRHDTTKPFASLRPFETSGPGKPVAVVVNYQDRPTGIRLSTIDDRDLQVVHVDSGDVLPVEFVGDFGNAISDLFAAALYRFTPHKTGAYELHLLPGEVEDMSGLTIDAKRLSIFWVVEEEAVATSPRRSLRSLVGRRST